MTSTISFMTANFVARELGYMMTRGWGEGENATREFFRPEKTFADRFDAMLAEVSGLGFGAIDLWSAHLHPDWATPGMIEQTAGILARRGISVSSLSFNIPNDLEKLEALAAVAQGVGTRIIGGMCAPGVLETRRDEFLAALESHDLVFGYENHPEKDAAGILDKVGREPSPRIGVTIDTGWFGSQGTSAPDAIRELGSRIVHVHLKDIVAPQIGQNPHDARVATDRDHTLKELGHETCALGDGVVDIPQCLEALREIGYTGGLSIEHEPEDRNPLEEVRISHQRLQNWLRN